MKPRTIASLARSGKGRLLLSIQSIARDFYRACFVASASSSGILKRLAAQPASFEQLAAVYAPEPSVHEGFRAWLDFGVILGELSRGADSYRLKGRLSRALARDNNDAEAAAVQELVSLHHLWISQSLSRFRERRGFLLSEVDAELVARSSRIVEPLVREAVDALVPRRGTIRLFEVGCGSAIYVRHAAERNPELTAVALELQPAVAMAARDNIQRWNLGGRVRVENGDLRQLTPRPDFDIATLHNNIYYFPVGDRVAVLTHLSGFLRPGGRVLLTTACRGYNAATEILNLWAALTEGCGPLPAPDVMVAQLRSAGFKSPSAKSLFPMSGFYAFTAEK